MAKAFRSLKACLFPLPRGIKTCRAFLWAVEEAILFQCPDPKELKVTRGCSRFKQYPVLFSAQTYGAPHMCRIAPQAEVSGQASSCMTKGNTLISGSLLVNFATAPRSGGPGWMEGPPPWPSQPSLPRRHPALAFPLSVVGLPLPAKVLKACGHRCGYCPPPGPVSGNSVEENEDTQPQCHYVFPEHAVLQINVSPTLSHHNIHTAHYWF